MTSMFADFRWRPLSRRPRRLWVGCSVCRYSTINEHKALRGWEETVHTPRAYRNPGCSSEEEG